jgi:hypothetical protein
MAMLLRQDDGPTDITLLYCRFWGAFVSNTFMLEVPRLKGLVGLLQVEQ